MLGHLEFVDEILTRKPELAKGVDSRKSSPLHLASAKGYLQIAKRLLQVDPDMYLVSDIDGRNPLLIAAMKGHLDVLLWIGLMLLLLLGHTIRLVTILIQCHLHVSWNSSTNQ
ncbi:hypothetical protein F3Y22_tig00002880pilonHSYRG00032 [Hibiscus syriacus]|uniref:Uncharacterized protein n=1 Tax=Hibiscus syriacus TaxID=106335 RepID=A0A6A3CMW1_HIBSY|nr:hypothetical protein F3Y22_tig00002880pilonHSYRG00032 [Hibiscus syriacus]